MFAVLFDGRIVSRDGASTNLRIAVFDDALAVDEMRDLCAAEHNGLCQNPLVSVVRIRCGVDAVSRVELARVNNVRPRGAHASRRARHAIVETSEELELDRNRKVLAGIVAGSCE